MHAFENTIKGPSAFGPTGNANIDKNVDSVAISMRQWSLGVSFAFKM